eukprot:7406673-Karenia_brevis.AAC.1
MAATRPNIRAPCCASLSNCATCCHCPPLWHAEIAELKLSIRAPCRISLSNCATCCHCSLFAC